MEFELFWSIFCAFWVVRIVGKHVSMAVKAEGDAILDRAGSAIGLLHYMVAFDLDAAELVAYAATSTSCH
jgi:hypothetical protein